MLEDRNQRNRGSGPPTWLVAIAVACIAGGAYSFGRRSGARAAPPPAPVTSPAAMAQAAPVAVPPPANPLPVGAVQGEGSPHSSHHVLNLSVTGSLDQTIEAAAPPGVGPALAMVVARLLVWWMSPAKDVRPGDQLSVVYDLPPGQEPEILALAYRSQKSGQSHETFRYQSPGHPFARYYTPDGQELEERLVGGPIEDYEQVTSLLRDGRGHKGVDFKAPLGTKVRSPVDGVIARRNWHWRMNGNCLEIVDGHSGRHVIFLHLEEVPKNMQPGVHVRAGEEVALSGNTGHTTAPHLHYQLMSRDGRVLDPFKVHGTTRASLSRAELPGLEAEVKELAPLLAPPEKHAER
ncbi:MAG: peptidoglycan DD-metalloendopeptidase family protein [Deltaproteobacteria bacterium]